MNRIVALKILTLKGKRKNHVYLSWFRHNYSSGIQKLKNIYKKKKTKGFYRFLHTFNIGFQKTQTFAQLLQWDSESLGGGCKVIIFFVGYNGLILK